MAHSLGPHVGGLHWVQGLRCLVLASHVCWHMCQGRLRLADLQEGLRRRLVHLLLQQQCDAPRPAEEHLPAAAGANQP